MRAYKIGADIADPRGFGDKLKYWGVYIFLERGEKFRLFDYKKFGLKLDEIGFVVYRLKGSENFDDLSAEFYATLITQELEVFGVDDPEEIDC